MNKEHGKKTGNHNKTKAWNRFSQWVRVRDCLASTGLPFVGLCITCGKKYHIRYLQAGHCFPGGQNARLFQEKIVRAQCRICNERNHGEHAKFRQKMEYLYGEKKVVEMEIAGKALIHDRDMDFATIEEKYRKKTNELLRKHGRYVTYEDMLSND